MFVKNAPCDMQDFGFDFASVHEKTFGAAVSTGNGDLHPHESESCRADHLKFCENEPSIKDIAEELRKVSEDTVYTRSDSEESGDLLTAADVMFRNNHARKEPDPFPIRKNQPSVRDLENEFSVESILEKVLERAQLAVSRGIIWCATQEDKIWKPLQTESQIARFLHSLGIRCYGNIPRWFEHRVSGDPRFRTPDFFEAVHHWAKVSFADGLLDLRTQSFTSRSYEDKVTAVLRWPYQDLADIPHYDRFKEAMQSLAVTSEAYHRLQEICGVALHAEPSGQILYFQHFNPRIASVFTKLLGKVWSEDSVSFLGLRDHERSFRTAQVLERPIVISGKEGESTLKDLSTVFALVDGDGINTDRKNLDPFDFVSRCSLICAGRDLPTLQKTSLQTLRYYLVRAKLTGDLPDGVSIRELLSYPREFLVWSLEGLQRFLLNHGHFTYDEDSDIPREDISIVNFVKELILCDPDGKLPASALHEAYANFCSANNMLQLPKSRLVSYLRDTFHIETKTVRASWFNGGRPSFGYTGISFSEEYMTEMLEEDDSDSWHQISKDNDEGDWEDSWEPHFVECGTLKVE